MKRLFKYTLPVIALCALASCSDDTTGDSSTPVDPNAGKELIALVGDNGYGMTRADLTPTGFKSATKVVMRIKAENSSSAVRYSQAVAEAGANITAAESATATTFNHFGLVGQHSDLTYASGQERYWDDAFGRDSKLTVYAVAVPDKSVADNKISSTILDQSSITGYSVVNSTTNPNWYTITDTENTKVTWTLSAAQSSSTMPVQDLAYSNNIRAGESVYNSRYHQTWDNTSSTWTMSMAKERMIWQSKNPDDATVTTGKFDIGHLVFKHALTWITIKLKEGDGFDNSSNSDFKWTGNTTQNITLKGFSTKGDLDISTGSWTIDTNGDVNITTMDETAGTAAAQTTRTLHAYVLPGTTLDGVNTNVVEFEIDNAKYYVSGDQIATAIQAVDGYSSFSALEAGKNYVINLTVAKKGIERITAAIVPWEIIESSDAAAKNTYCTFDFEDRNDKYDGDEGSKFQIYRAEKTADGYIISNDYASHTNAYAWGTTYQAATGKTWDSTNSEWEATNWFWKDNKTFYHFRAAGSTEGTIPSITTTTNDYFTITSGAIFGSDYKDYTWGAPFYDKRNTDTNDWDEGYPLLTYSTTKGFDGTGAEASTPTHQISKAIAATDDQIQMLMFHMTSQITVKVQTTSDASAVTLEDGTNYTSVEIINMLPTGTVQMGDGLVTAGGTRANYTTITKGTKTDGIVPFTYGIIPQELSYTESSTTKYIGLRITTPDNNQYLVNQLSACYATVTTNNLANPYTTEHSSNSGTYLIDRWYPNYQYVYTVTVSKKGIERITAAVVPWETVTGDLGTIDLEN